MRILIVEDDFISRNVLQHILSEFGTCDIAVDGQEAVAAFKRSWGSSSPYDLICMDIMMPGLDGHEALDQIQHFGGHVSKTVSRLRGVHVLENRKVIQQIVAIKHPR